MQITQRKMIPKTWPLKNKFPIPKINLFKNQMPVSKVVPLLHK